MAPHAVDALDDARDVTVSTLLPVSWRTWLRLTVVTFFVSGVGGGGSIGQGVQGIVSSPRPPGATLGRLDPPSLPTVVPERVTVLLVAVAALVGVAAVGYALLGSVMEFVLVDGLRNRRFPLRRASRRFLGPGVRLFAFRTGVVVLLAGSAALSLLAALGVLTVSSAGVLFVPVLTLVTVLVWLAGVVCLRLTTDFVVPTMLAEGRSVLAAWRRLLPLVRTAWRDVLLYLLVRLGLGLAATVAVGLVVGLAALVIAVPFALLGSAVVATVGLQGSGLVAVAVLVVGFVPLVGVAAVVAQVPVVVYFRCYGLVLLGRLDARLALLSPE